MAGAVSALFLLDVRVHVLIWWDYRGDVSPVQAERFFAKLIEKEVFKHYFEELEEESLRDNFVVVYELLDEMMDFGFPLFRFEDFDNDATVEIHSDIKNDDVKISS